MSHPLDTAVSAWAALATPRLAGVWTGGRGSGRRSSRGTTTTGTRSGDRRTRSQSWEGGRGAFQSLSKSMFNKLLLMDIAWPFQPMCMQKIIAPANCQLRLKFNDCKLTSQEWFCAKNVLPQTDHALPPLNKAPSSANDWINDHRATSIDPRSSSR